MLVAWLAFPLALAAICAGLGLLLDALGGRRLPGALVVPAGFAGLIVIAQAMALVDATAPYAASLAIVLAAVGLIASLPWRFGRPDPWPIGAALAAFALFAAPVLLSGHPTFASYGDLADTPTWLAIAERVMEHGRDLGGLDPSTYKANLEATLGSGDPIGAVLPLAAAHRLLGGEAAWSFQPYLATLGALLTLSAWQIARAVDFWGAPAATKSTAVEEPSLQPPPSSRAALAFLAAVPALIFGYAGWGGVQELAAATLLVLAASLALLPRRGETRTRANSRRMRFTSWVPLAIVALALLSTLAPWPPSFPLQADAWLGTLALAALIAATLGLSIWIARSQPAALLATFAAALTACAIVASAGADLAPYNQLSELRQINASYAKQGPALVFERTPYGSHYFLRDVPPDDAGDPAGEAIALSPSASGREPLDADEVDYRALLSYSLLVIPRSPEQSRPPLPYRRVWLGEDYEVWRLPSTAGFRLLFHMPIGGPLNAIGLPDCSQTVGLGLLALANQLGAAPQDITLIAAAPRRGDRLGSTVGVSVDRAQELCGRRWDWIEAIAPAG